LAELGAHHDQIRAAGGDVAALSVDDGVRAEEVRQRYRLPFPVLCDTAGRVVRAWDLFNAAEMGGIARPATFVIEPDRRIQLASVDGVAARLRAAELRAYLEQLRAERGAPAAPRRRLLVPRIGELLRTAAPVLKALVSPPPKRG